MFKFIGSVLKNKITTSVTMAVLTFIGYAFSFWLMEQYKLVLIAVEVGAAATLVLQLYGIYIAKSNELLKPFRPLYFMTIATVLVTLLVAVYFIQYGIIYSAVIAVVYGAFAAKYHTTIAQSYGVEFK